MNHSKCCNERADENKTLMHIRKILHNYSLPFPQWCIPKPSQFPLQTCHSRAHNYRCSVVLGVYRNVHGRLNGYVESVLYQWTLPQMCKTLTWHRKNNMCAPLHRSYDFVPSYILFYTDWLWLRRSKLRSLDTVSEITSLTVYW